MILVKLRGGLSNQMFQYAAGRRLSHVHNTELKIDIDWYKNIQEDTTPRNFELNNFRITASIASKNDLIGTNGIRNTSLKDLPIAIYRKVKPKVKYIEEKHFHFDEDILHLPDNICLYGYWVSEKYFKDIEDIIRKEFILRNEHGSVNNKTIDIINSTNSVALHIRRGDYVNNPNINNIHGTCSMDYYIRCIKFLYEKNSSLHFFIFSDDMKWVKENFKLPYDHIYIENNCGDKSYQDLHLMSLCKHQIIANSGFSWWGAWLNTNKKKIVCAPEKWFNINDHDTKDVIPANWIKF